MTYARDATPPFYHGTRANLQLGDLLAPGFASNYQEQLRIVGEVTEWDPHPPERLKEMKDALARMEAEGDMKIID